MKVEPRLSFPNCPLAISPPNTSPTATFSALAAFLTRIWCVSPNPQVLSSKPPSTVSKSHLWVLVAVSTKSNSVPNAITSSRAVPNPKLPQLF